MPVFDRSPKTLPTETYVVVADVQNLHIAGRKVLAGDEIDLSAPVAAHWLTEGVLALKPAPKASKTTDSAKTTDGAA